MLNSSPVLLTSRPFYLLKEWRKLWLFVNLSALEQILMCQLFQMKRPNVLGSFRYCCKRKQMKNTCGLCLSGWSFKKEARWFWEVYHRNMQVWNYMGWCLSNVKIHVGIFSHWRSLLVILTVSSCFFLIFHFFFLLMRLYGFTIPAVTEHWFSSYLVIRGLYVRRWEQSYCFAGELFADRLNSFLLCVSLQYFQ